MTSIKDIAAQAGLSASTVSFILNGRGDALRIAPATQQRVLEIAAELGYRPNVSARRLKGQGRHPVLTVAVFWVTTAEDNLLGRLFRGFQESLAQGKTPTELMVQPVFPGELAKVKGLSGGALYQGAIVTHSSDEEVRFLESIPVGFPIVLFNRPSERLSTVQTSDSRGGAQVAEVFHAKGHRHVALVMVRDSSQNLQALGEGFVRRCLELGMEVVGTLVPEGSPDVEAGERAARSFLATPSQTGVRKATALFFTTDSMAFGAIALWQAAGIRIPDDIEIFGYGDSPYGRLCRPGLSVVRVPVEEMAAAALDLVEQLVRGELAGPQHREFPSSLVFRESCREP